MWQSWVFLIGTVLANGQAPEQLPPPTAVPGPAIPAPAASTEAAPAAPPMIHPVEGHPEPSADHASPAGHHHPLAWLRWFTYCPLQKGGYSGSCFPLRRPALYTYFYYPPCTEGCAPQFHTCCGKGGCFGGACATGHKMFASPTGQSCGLIGH